MAEKVAKLSLERDYKKFLYYIDTVGNVCRKAKHSKEAVSEILVPNAITRDSNYLFFIDKDGDVSRAQRSVRGKKKAVVPEG